MCYKFVSSRCRSWRRVKRFDLSARPWNFGALVILALAKMLEARARFGRFVFLMRLETFRTQLQPHLDAFVADKTRSYSPLLHDAFLRELLDYPALLANASGKRIRPYVAFLIFRSGCDDAEMQEKALRTLVSLELFHLFCLVHDDIIDKGTQRYGLPTIHAFAARHLREKNTKEAEHIAQSHAILIGDLLFSWSHEALNGGDFSHRVLDCARRVFTTMIDEVVIGQMLDVDLMTKNETSRAVIERKIHLKTASYTFVRPMQIGAALSGVSCDVFCQELGLALGMAFQVQDDLLDLVGTPRTTQKTLFADLRDGTHTLFTQHIFESRIARDIDDLRALMGADLTVADRHRVLDLFTRTGALEVGRQIVHDNLCVAKTLLDNGTLRDQERDGFLHLISILEARDKK